MQWMRPKRTNQLPRGEKWQYEMKYDGYRALLTWDGKKASLTSKGGHSLEKNFPEVIDDAQRFFPTNQSFALDGELVILENRGRADFYALQRRFRLRTEKTFKKESSVRPAAFLAFDCLEIHNKSLLKEKWADRKSTLTTMFKDRELPLAPNPQPSSSIQLIPAYKDLSLLMEENTICRGEGIVAKKIESTYETGRTENWIKYKTPFAASCFVTAFDPENNYFHLGVFDEEQVISIGKCAHGFSREELEALIKTVKDNGDWDNEGKLYTMEPAIALEVAYTTRKNNELREPRFSQFLLQQPVKQCTVESLQLSDLRFPESVDITHPDKLLWADYPVKKIDFLRYVRYGAPVILPFLKDRPLTVIRYPHGTFEKGFFQKDCPDYAPEFVNTVKIDDNDFILCNKIEILLWLANQLALEWHIPFQRHHTSYVDEIVFDLDPPSPAFFHLAIEGSIYLKELCDSFDLTSFVKFSGNKGIQVYIPLPENTYTWEDTNQITEAFGTFLTKTHPELFTQERRKKNRGNKLYIDIPQHRQGKTIIAPYSLRGKEKPLVACPLYWDEVSSSLDREQFTMENVLKRLETRGCPFQKMKEAGRQQPVDRLLDLLQQPTTSL